jgi:hypothetical protein
MSEYIEILSSISVSEVEQPSELPVDNVLILECLSIESVETRGLPKSNDILSCMSLPSAPYPLEGGGEPTELKDLRTKIIRSLQR